MKYAHIDENNKILGWYSKDIHDKIPTPNVEVEDEVWQEAININANYYNAETKSFEYKDFRTKDEIAEQEKQAKRIEANTYLSQTDWVETYYIKHLLKIETIENNSSKWDIINKREEYKALLKTLNS